MNFSLHSPASEILLALACWKAGELVTGGYALARRYRGLSFRVDRGWPCHPHRNLAWQTTHKFDWSELQLWPWWRLGFDLVRLGTDPATSDAWGFWIYSRRGGKRADLYLTLRAAPAAVSPIGEAE